MRRIIVIIGLVWCCSNWLAAQQIAAYNLYMFHPNIINPAATGISPCRIFTLTDKHQWLGIEGAPSIQTLSLQTGKQFHKYRKYGLGLNVVRDKNGVTQNLGGELLYAFHFRVGNASDQYLSLGLSAKAGQYSFDERDFTANLPDPAVSRTVETEWYYNASAGIYYYNRRYFGGIGMYNLLPVTTRYYQLYGNENYFLTALAGFNLLPGRRRPFTIKSSAYVCSGTDYLQIDVNSTIYFQNNIQLGISLRKYTGDFMQAGQNILFLFGYVYNKLTVYYSFDAGLNNLQEYNYGSHLIALQYKICPKKYACPTYKK